MTRPRSTLTNTAPSARSYEELDIDHMVCGAGAPGQRAPCRSHHLVDVELLTMERASGALGQSGVWFMSSGLSSAGRAAGEHCTTVVLLLSPTPPARKPTLPA